MPWLRKHKPIWLMWSIVARSLLAKMLLALRATLLTSCIKILEVREWKKDRERMRKGGFMDWSHVLSALQLSSQSRRHIKIRAAFETSAQMLILLPMDNSTFRLRFPSNFFPCDKIFFLSYLSFSIYPPAQCVHLSHPFGQAKQGDSRKWSERVWWEPSKSTLRRQKMQAPFLPRRCRCLYQSWWPANADMLPWNVTLLRRNLLYIHKWIVSNKLPISESNDLLVLWVWLKKV